MSVWHRLLQLTSASPFTGTWMSLGTAAGALLAFLLFRRILPADDDFGNPKRVPEPSRDGASASKLASAPRARQQSSATPVLLGIGLLLGLFRLVLVALGAHESTTGKVVSVLTTFFVALGAVNTVVMFVFEVLPVLVSIGARGMNQSVTTLQPGSFFGEMSLVTGEPRTATCAARTDVLGYVIDHATLRPLLTTRPHLVEHLSSLLATRQAALYEKEGELSARAAHEGESKKRLLERIRTFFDLR